MIIRYTHEVVKYRAAKSVVCECGKHVRRQTTFEQTINPYNQRPDGQLKSRADIMDELRTQARRWETKPELCSACAAKKGA